MRSTATAAGPEGTVGTIAAIAGLIGLVWLWARGTREDADQLVERQQRWAQREHDQPVALSNPDHVTGPPGPAPGAGS
jgi:hypothetical protein